VPELPEVEVVRRGLAPHVCGRKIRSVCLNRRDLRYPLPDLHAALRNRACIRLGRRGKYLLFFFDETLLVWHLGMTGQFHLLPADAARTRHEHVRITFRDGGALRYRDARRFGYAGLLPVRDWRCHPWFSGLGPEPLGDAFDGACLKACCAGRKAPIKSVLMNARVVAGIGNIYACEALFHAGIHPGRAAGRISEGRLDGLARCIREVLSEAIEAGGSTINDFVRVDGRPGYFAHAFRVYGRTGEPCRRCSGRIRRIVLAGRGTFYCPGCQH